MKPKRTSPIGGSFWFLPGHKSSIIEGRKILLFGIEAIFLFGYMKEFHEHYLQLLQLTEYEVEAEEEPIEFGYQSSSHENLIHLREKYHLEKVAGTGDELTQIKNNENG